MPPIDLTSWLVVVPARLGSTRLPRKPLADLAGKPLIVRVYENLKPLLAYGAEIVVATDHIDVQRVLEKANIPCRMTRVEHPSGSDRILEAAEANARPYILNVQGDEPTIQANDLVELCKTMQQRPSSDIGTLVYPLNADHDLNNPNVVKAVVASNGRALYFSRSPIPYRRNPDEPLPSGDPVFWQHIGVYAYRRPSLARFCALPPSPLELIEKLEQLRALEAGMEIITVRASKPSVGIDTPQDLAKAQTLYG